MGFFNWGGGGQYLGGGVFCSILYITGYILQIIKIQGYVNF